MSGPLAPQAPVTLLDVYTKQIQIVGRLDVISEQLKAIPDHETRLRILENARAKLMGGAIAAGALVGGLSGWAAVILSRK